jgi:transcriptional antiterminator RfaH
LFPSYVFLHGDNQERVHALETNVVARVIPVEDQPQLHQDLAAVYCLIQSGTAMTPEDRLEPGDRVEITGGPLAGLEGRIIRRGKHLRFLVEVHFLQQGVSVEMESWMIKPLMERQSVGAGGTSAR